MEFRETISWPVAGMLLAMSGSAAASGFALYEHGSGLGNAFAGGAASAEDASTIHFNPAGLSRLSGKQIVVAAHAIRPSMKFSGTGLLPATDMGGDAGSWALVPNGYFAVEIDPKWTLGIGMNSPFGLQTEYTSTWVGRAHAIKSKLETINLNPSVAYQVNDSLSLGAGISYQHIRGELTANPAATSISSLTGSDSSWGYNFGALVNASPQTRFGLAYRSGINYNLSGRVNFTGPLAGLSGPATLAVKMPASFSASVFHQIDSKWDVMADATWMDWSVFRELRVIRLTALPPILPVPENWSDSWRVAIGGNYHYNNRWMARIGAAYDQTPVSDAFRTARVPDASRYQLAVGGQYKPGTNSALDFGYTHLFVNNASIDSSVATPSLVGNYKSSVDILSVAYVYSF